MCISKNYCAEQLNGYHSQDAVFGQWLWATQFCDLDSFQHCPCYSHGRILTSGWAWMIACLLVRCGSSVYDQKKLSFWALPARPLESVFAPGSKVVVTVDGMVVNKPEQGVSPVSEFSKELDHDSVSIHCYWWINRSYL